MVVCLYGWMDGKKSVFFSFSCCLFGLNIFLVMQTRNRPTRQINFSCIVVVVVVFVVVGSQLMRVSSCTSYDHFMGFSFWVGFSLYFAKCGFHFVFYSSFFFLLLLWFRFFMIMLHAKCLVCADSFKLIII